MSITTMISCSYEPEISSRVTVYPILTINGETIMPMSKGTAYKELGAVSKAGSATLPVTTSGTVDSNTIGVYKVNYSSENADGFSVTATRTVIIMDPNPSQINLAGNWYRGAGLNVVTRISDRKYSCTNATGYINGNANNLAMIFYNLDDKKVYAPFQLNCSETGISAESNIGTVTSANAYNWVIYASGFFGTAVRSFIR